METWLILSIIILLIILMGLIHVVRELKGIEKQCEWLNEFSRILDIFAQKLKLNDIPKEQLNYIITNGDKASELSGETSYYMPILELINCISSSDWGYVDSLIQKAQVEIVRKNGDRADIYKVVKKDYWNPITLFCRGVELLLEIIFGYIIKRQNPGFDFTSKTWRCTVNISSIASGIASIIELFRSFYS